MRFSSAAIQVIAAYMYMYDLVSALRQHSDGSYVHGTCRGSSSFLQTSLFLMKIKSSKSSIKFR